MSTLFRHLPSMAQVLAGLDADADMAALPRPLVKEHVNGFLDLCREEIRAGIIADKDALALAALMPRLTAYVRSCSRPHFRRVLNGTGVVIHTNLGRSLLARPAIEAVAEACAHYSNCEFDLTTGKRGSRYSHVEKILCDITGAEAALVVNNNAAAVFIMLETLARGREVVVSRGQLVEIGGSFRIPDVMAKSGAILREVGATNRTHAHDYEQAIGDETAALMRVHTSNFRMVGFTKEVSLPEMRALGDRYGLPVIEDLGSGTLYALAGDGLLGEPTVQQVVAQGADVVSFSGDKVLGGPQAGIIVGRKEYVDRIKKNPINRAVRIDKMTLAALEATLRLYLDMDVARREVPTLRMITASQESLRSKARRLADAVRAELGDMAEVTMRKGFSRVGGGAFPEYDLPGTLVTVNLVGISADALRDALFDTDPPLVARIEDDVFLLDPRTLASSELKLAANALRQAVDTIKDNT
ncbi:MAG: L-seryl-tRNA(Sec) selenium transferase [Pseudodesulfovibrio sp.]|uniref:L-seryl-tRNA(Sec) selenium transferase n=1 Tax=Pseudodesulfovibrio aespoeensis (strain ATCC 700646 / DSM 10631 / Aspo-2) TaxID=643562 RepID=E6VTJ0_PSEA9|nr:MULTISPECIES: L-seryl-tRNA(Sec) selenium transferase [Pseudodesulfovibrio]MBU4192788.1 L-seryl-tRNA(Sec) selenium transferase [Pseudomonadota bacterium]ADU62167.1 L-seryl-tRNA selenium transferase [Pseudodesulfovibrio aespoeensis Aspo-2]MBU4244784.1 L-seryl-tRNA(Sec) selenium transferase [Pseudomonadota bacterium]MBU4380520.1 L-seryl-tRNA(Sec) selenium transferase [Pseudomonadota bacterium]MBU4476144.1 L-seryl-tRNA(Sec) selenium transferase [Pseudomonadota bacterium]